MNCKKCGKKMKRDKNELGERVFICYDCVPNPVSGIIDRIKNGIWKLNRN
jgi:hypothetical protein